MKLLYYICIKLFEGYNVNNKFFSKKFNIGMKNQIFMFNKNKYFLSSQNNEMNKLTASFSTK